MSDPGPIERVVVFDIESECAARGCDDDAEVLLVAQLSNGGLAARWVCRAHEAGAVPRDLAVVVDRRGPPPSEVH